MAYGLAKISTTASTKPAFRAGMDLARLYEHIARSPVGAGFLQRTQLVDACFSLQIDGELVHLEDFVLHDATRDIRTLTRELTIARDVLRRGSGNGLIGFGTGPRDADVRRVNTASATARCGFWSRKLPPAF